MYFRGWAWKSIASLWNSWAALLRFAVASAAFLYSSSSRGFSAPAGTPKEAVDAVSGAIQRVVASDEHKKRMAEMGLTLRYMDAGQYAKYWSEYEAMLTELLPLAKE